MRLEGLDTGPHGGDTEGVVLPGAALALAEGAGLEAGVADELGKVGLGREALNALDEVLVRSGVAGDDLADDGDDLERVLAVSPVLLATFHATTLTP